MAETLQIPTTTTLTTVGNTIKAFTFYDEGVQPYVLEAFIADDAGIIDGVPYIEGELVITMNNYPAQINFSIDSVLGDLIIWALENSSNYDIIADGNLQYTY